MLLCNDFRHEVREDLQSEFLSLQVVLLLYSLIRQKLPGFPIYAPQ